MSGELTEYGKAFEYEPEFQGPKRYRKSTDVGCIYLFIVFMILWGGIGIFALIKGDLSIYKIDTTSKTKSSSSTYELDESELEASFTDDLKHGFGYIIAGLIISILATIIYICVLRWVAKVMVWISLVFIAIVLFVAATAIMYLYFTAQFKDNGRTTTLIIGILFYVFLIIYIAFLYYMRKRIRLAIALIKESSKAIGDMMSTLFFPIIPSIIQMTIFIFGFAVIVYLNSFGKPSYIVKMYSSTCDCTGPAASYHNNSECVPEIFNAHCNGYYCNARCAYDGWKLPIFAKILHGFNLFGMYWGSFFIYAFVEMVLAGAFATWYWTMPKSKLESSPVLTSLGRTFRYHMGTIAFGSLIITLIRMVRILLDSLQEQLRKSDNGVARVLAGCLECVFKWIEEVMKFINRNAYIMTAVHGYNFCRSAKEAFSLLMRNIIRVYVLDKVTETLLGLSKLILVIAVSCISYVMFRYISSYDYHYTWLLVFIVALFTILISTVFFDAFSMAIDTIFICYLEDSERNDGSAERPYFMSHKLAKIFNKEEQEDDE